MGDQVAPSCPPLPTPLTNEAEFAKLVVAAGRFRRQAGLYPLRLGVPSALLAGVHPAKSSGETWPHWPMTKLLIHVTPFLFMPSASPMKRGKLFLR
ncbi:hypothetical protein AAFF_G00187250 [Aldrovandia affinis]|uniref:Uncharacterized protein n=1 Tax=Aldrovandia affinis TaxID=143900 RepID=A0AAD7SY07_9TELE|nr:hypothetical protein AAFF_G00187250 [Aldrovandia affinis]